MVFAAAAVASCVAASPKVADSRTAPPVYRPAPYQAPPRYQVVVPVPPATPRPMSAPQALVTNIAALGRSFNGRVGIAVRSVDNGWSVQTNGDALLPQQSVSKLWVAMTVLDFRDAGKLRLEDPVTLKPEDLTLFHQPIAALIKADGYQTTIGALLQRALTMSDNTANDRLLRYVGGPKAVRAFIQRKQLGDIRFAEALFL